jgi:hypothetical protein
MRLAWFGVGAMFATSVLAGTGCSTKSPSPNGDAVHATTQAIQDGTVDSSNTSPFAVGVCPGTGSLGSGNCLGVCSGALILPNVVATARHCIDNTPKQIDCSTNPVFGARRPGSFRITTNVTMGGAASGWYAVQAIAVPDDDHICGNDIALLVLSSSIPAAVAKPVTPGVQYLMWDHDQYSALFIGVGYGKTSPSTDGSGTRRISQPISVLCVPGSDDRPCPPEINAKEFVGGDGVCSGDSGSSAFDYWTFGNGAPVSFGVLSRGGESADGTKCESSIYTRFDAHRDFVLAIAKAASNDWALYPEPSWTAYKPPYQPNTPKKDAGASKDAAPVTKPSGLGFGESCETADQCSSGACSDAGDGTMICSQSCDEGTSCPDGYECRESLCLPPAAPAAPPAAAKTTTSGCAAAPGSSGSWGLAALGAVLAMAAARRRKR